MNRHQTRIGWWQGCLLATILFLLSPVGRALAADSKPADSPPATKFTVTMSNWQQYQQYMDDGTKALFRGDHFFQLPPEVQINVGPTIPIALPKAYREATEKYSSQVQLKEVSPGVYQP